MPQETPLKDKVALITGSSRGIGRAIALELARQGATVVANYANDEASAQSLLKEIEGLGGKAIAVKADVSKAAEVKRLFDEAIKKFGKLDILVNNAGIIHYKLISETTEEDFDRLFALNVKGVFLGCKEAATRLSEGGRIINLSSNVTAMMLPTYGPYAATKGAVEQLTRVLAKELGSKKINVNAVSPGPTETELFMTGKTPEQLARLAGIAAFNRIAQPEEIASVVAFLAGPGARWITGQNIRANGGAA